MDQYSLFLPYQYFYPACSSAQSQASHFFIHGPLLNQSNIAMGPQELETSYNQLLFRYQQLLLENQALKKDLQNATSYPQSPPATTIPRRRIKRRKETELDKKHHCCYDHCRKEYASILALNLHIKTRHQGGTKKQRDSLAKSIILAEMRGEAIPQSQILLPSNYVQSYRKQHFSDPECQF